MINKKSNIIIGRSLLILYVGLLAITFSHHHNIVIYSSNHEKLTSSGFQNQCINTNTHHAFNCPVFQLSSTSYIGTVASEMPLRFDTQIPVKDKLSREIFTQLFSLSLLRAPPSESLS